MGTTRRELALRTRWLAMRAAGRVSSRAGGSLAAQLYFIPWKARVSDATARRRARWLADTQALSFDLPGMQLSGYSGGSGPRVLLVHGWGDSAGTMAPFVPRLIDAGLSVTAIDLPAHGASGGSSTTTIEIATAIETIAERLNVEAVIAHSIGGHATVLALARALQVRAVVLLAPAVRPDHVLDRFVSLFELPPKAAAGLRDRIEKQFGPSVWSDLAADRLAQGLNVPALIVHDRSDEQVPFEDAEALQGAWPGARLIETRGLDHRQVVRSDEVVERTVAFLQTELLDAPQTAAVSAAT